MGYRKKKKNGFFTRQGKRLEKAAEKFTAARERSAARSDRRQTATLSRLKAKAEREKLITLKIWSNKINHTIIFC